jgi:glycosyltransferase involved in cell wall biosynthesis
MGNAPTVSVALAVYNSEPYLAEAIESILNQTFQDFELLIIDDGSTDNSVAIVKRYADRDSRIRWVTQPNAGIPKTRNRLLAMATGEFIAVMDADDVALPDRFERQVAYLRSSSNTVCVGGAYQIMDGAGRFLTVMRLAEDNAEIQRILLDGHTSFLHPACMIRKTAMEQVGGYNEAFATASDLDIWLKLTEVGEVANLHAPILKYRVHAKSISERNRQQQWNNGEIVFDQAWQRRGLTRTFAVTGCRMRHSGTKDSAFEYMLKYGWWAFNSAQRQTAVLYGVKAIALKPLAIDGWKLLICAVIKPTPHPDFL